MFTWYCVHEKTNYQDIQPGLREDIGEYVVAECNADSVKSTLIYEVITLKITSRIQFLKTNKMLLNLH